MLGRIICNESSCKVLGGLKFLWETYEEEIAVAIQEMQTFVYISMPLSPFFHQHTVLPWQCSMSQNKFLYVKSGYHY